MAINFNTLFTRLGHIGKVGYVLAGTQAGVPALLTTLFGDYTGTSDVDLIGGIISAEDQIPAGVVSPTPFVASVAASTLIRMVQADVPSVNALVPALVELIRQMRAGSETVKASAITSTTAALSTNIGSGVVVTTTKRGDGLVQEDAVAEILRVSCIADSYTGGATQGQETFAIAGPLQTVGLWNYNYPTGSGANNTTGAISADENSNDSGNVLSNSDFEDWSGSPNAADDWTIGGGGAWATDVVEDTTNPMRGTRCAKWVASANNTFIYQQFNSGTGTAVNPVPLTSYAVNLWLRKESGTISAGVLTVELVDGSGTVINDQQGTANSFTVTLSSLTTSYVAYNGVFRIPNVPPSTIRLRFRLSTALSGANFLMDDVAMSRVTAAYPGGCSAVIFSGATPFVAGDGWNWTATNDRGGATYLATFQALFDRFFNMKQNGLLLPSTSGVATQPDTKITA